MYTLYYVNHFLDDQPLVHDQNEYAKKYAKKLSHIGIELKQWHLQVSGFNNGWYFTSFTTVAHLLLNAIELSQQDL